VFEWDTEKARLNVAKHGVSFEEAATVFEDPSALDGDDVLHSAGETRRLRIGASRDEHVLVVAYIIRGGAVRIISARRASRRERARYAEA
jgi:uncharacterized DUF497 family protein